MKFQYLLLFLFLFTFLNGKERPTFVYEKVVADIPPDSLYSFNDSLAYIADSTHIAVDDQQAELLGNATIYYTTSTIKSDTLFIDNKNQVAKADGQIWMQDGSQKILGEAMLFSVEDQRGIIKDGAGKFEKGYFYGEEIRKIGENTYDLTNGIFTSCEAKEPHYYIKSKQMRIYRNDKVIVRPAVFYINHFPILAAPFGSFSIKKGRKSGFLMPSPGMNSNDGKYIEDIAYFYAWKDYVDVLAGVDVYEKKGWKANFDTYYKKRYQYYGSLQYDFDHTSEYSSTWKWYQKHYQTFANESILNLTVDLMATDRFGFGDSVEERTKHNFGMSGSYTYYLYGKRMTVFSTYNKNILTDQRSMSYFSTSLNFSPRPVTELYSDHWEKPDFLQKLSLSYRTSTQHRGYVNGKDPDFNSFLHSNPDTTSTGETTSEHHTALRHRFSSSYNYKLGWLNLSHGANYNEIWYDRDKNQNKFVRGYDYNFNTSSNLSIYGVKYFKNKPISAIRHIIKPSVSYRYTPKFKNNRFYSTPYSLSSGEKKQSYSFGLSQNWQIKLPAINENLKERVINDLMSMNSSFSYNPESEGKGFSNINHTLNFKQINFKVADVSVQLSEDYSMQQDFYNLDILNWSLNSSLSLKGKNDFTTYFPEEPNRFDNNKFVEPDSLFDKKETYEWLDKEENWKATLSHNYTKNKTKETTNDLDFSLNFNLSAKWQASISSGYNFLTKKNQGYRLNINRELHCWKLQIKITHNEAYWEYYVKLFDIKLPNELKIDQRGNSN